MSPLKSLTTEPKSESVSFLTDYLDYDTDDKVYHLSIFFLNNEELEVYVDRDDFKYTLEFLETFNELYWV